MITKAIETVFEEAACTQRQYITKRFSSSLRLLRRARTGRRLSPLDSAGWPRSPNNASVLQNECFHVMLLFPDNFGCHLRLIGALLLTFKKVRSFDTFINVSSFFLGRSSF